MEEVLVFLAGVPLVIALFVCKWAAITLMSRECDEAEPEMSVR